MPPPDNRRGEFLRRNLPPSNLIVITHTYRTPTRTHRTPTPHPQNTHTHTYTEPTPIHPHRKVYLQKRITMFKKIIFGLSFVRDREKEFSRQIMELRAKLVAVESGMSRTESEANERLIAAERRAVELVGELDVLKTELADLKG